jgi:hypothetical protein
VGPDEANARYFRDRDDNLRITAPYQLIKGIVA